jgi:hypothetical protein
MFTIVKLNPLSFQPIFSSRHCGRLMFGLTRYSEQCITDEMGIYYFKPRFFSDSQNHEENTRFDTELQSRVRDVASELRLSRK